MNMNIDDLKNKRIVDVTIKELVYVIMDELKKEQSKIFTINQLDNKDNRSYFKEFYIKRGSTGEVYGNEVSLFQYLTFTTEKPEKNAIEIYKDKYDTYESAIEHFILDLSKSNMSMGNFVKEINNKNNVL